MSKPLSFVDVLRAADLRIFRYSGRSMYGKECVAVDCEGTVGEMISAVFESIAGYNQRSAQDEALELCAKHFGSMLQDSLGRGGLAYWPGVAWEKAYDSDSAEEDAVYA